VLRGVGREGRQNRQALPVHQRRAEPVSVQRRSQRAYQNKELIKIDQEIRENDWEWLGIYHSHTHTEAYPSATDIRLAYWPDTLYFIISLKDPDRPVLRAFYIRDGRVEEVPVEIVPEQAPG